MVMMQIRRSGTPADPEQMKACPQQFLVFFDHPFDFRMRAAVP
jgi:hypothetical protein